MRIQVLAFSACVVLRVGQASADVPVRLPTLAQFRLANGLDVLIEENHRAPQVAVAVSYDVGARDEAVGYLSLAHLVEHLTFRRSAHLKQDFESFTLLERAGSQKFNGETSNDRTVYYAVVPSKALPLALWVESERMGFTLETFDDAGVEHERPVLRAELNERQNAYQRFYGHVIARLYGKDHPYGRRPDRSRDLDRLTAGDARRFFQRAYRPDNAHLVIVGDVTVEAGRALVERYFADVVASAMPAPPRAPITPASTTLARLTYRTREYASQLMLVYAAPASRAPEHVAAEVLVQLLRALLVSSIVHEQRLATSLEVEMRNTAADSQLIVRAKPRHGVSSLALELGVRGVLEQLTATAVAKALSEARGALVEREWLTLEDPLVRARGHIDALAADGKPRLLTMRVNSILGVSEEDIEHLLPTLRAPLVVATMFRDPAADDDGTVQWSEQ